MQDGPGAADQLSSLSASSAFARDISGAGEQVNECVG
jgi:hypothetical protein